MNNVTKDYKLADDNMVNSINKEAKKLAVELKVADRLQQYAHRDAFVTLKDHKENFRSNPKCRLINPVKSDVGQVSKHILVQDLYISSEILVSIY